MLVQVMVTLLEIVETFEKATGVKLNWKYGPRREGDIEKIWGDCTKANEVLGWKAEAKLEDVLASAWKWQQAPCRRNHVITVKYI